MAKDDTSPGGLLSKMVKFVRSPGTQWNDLDDPSSAKDGSLSKQALKEMIERKRRNDFVRKREFDMLRKLRRREATGGGSISDAEARPSFFQSSMPSRPDDRAMTLKKIDEIEAQMSMQWWKTKHGAGGGAPSTSTSSEFTNSNVGTNPAGFGGGKMSAPDGLPTPLAYARTVADDLQGMIARQVGMLPTRASDANSNIAPSAPPLRNGFPTPSLASAVPTRSTQAPVAQVPMRQEPVSQEPAPQAPRVQQGPLGPARAGGSATPGANNNSLDFTAEPAPVGKPLVKPSPYSAAPVPAPTPRAPHKSSNGLGGLAASYDASGASTGFSVSKLFAIEVDEVQHDPELEEAAIRFANGDDGGAEAGLLEAVSASGPRQQHEETWMTLFDLYRATSQYDRFESLSIDFANKFNRSAPIWFSIPEEISQMAGLEAMSPIGMRKADWKSPAVIGIQSLAALNGALAKASMPWTLDWASLQSIDEDAVATLTKLFLSWAAQPVQLRMAHSDPLDKVLRDGAPSGIQTTSQERWNLLLAYLRISHRPDEFELAALDFCVTYEVSPPSWESARCECKFLDAEGHTGLGQTIVGEATHDTISSELQTDAGSSIMTTQLTSVELSGQIMGEPKPVLDQLEARLAGADMMIISCAKLVRVDFSAAGSLLNWVTARQSEGRIVQFTDVHRLVAAFFHVIGISEHAKVMTRTD